ncbi:hypothetical protein BH10PSE19_BH10PSE19_17510 [soil metagenome]
MLLHHQLLRALTHPNSAKAQEGAAPILRQAAIEELRSGKSTVACAFRGGYLPDDFGGGNHEVFLRKQEKNGVWATYIELAALGALFNCQIVVISVTKGVVDTPHCLHRPDDPKAACITLYNRDNVHWDVHPTEQHALPDGNCCYNTFILAWRAAHPKALVQSAPLHKWTQFSTSDKSADKKATFAYEEAISQHQRQIEASIQRQPTVTQLAKELQQQEERIKALSPEEQKQIADDHAMAVEMAGEERVASMRCGR